MAKRSKAVTRKGYTRYYDYSLLAVLVFLICFGLVMLYSTSAYSAQVTYQDDMYYFKRQLIISLASFGMMLVISRIDYRKYGKIAKYLFFFAFFLMLLVRFSPLGVSVNGAKRWIEIPVIHQRFQPSEIMKIAVILFIPIQISKMKAKLKGNGYVLNVMLWGMAAFGGVYYLTDNLSTALIVLGIVLILIFVTHPKMAPFLAIGGAGVAALAVGIPVLAKIAESSDNFRLRRILVWLHPEEYAGAGSFQAMQGFYAIGSGGFFGKGLGNSAQKMIIPEVQNDMILSIICEELGVFGAIVILILFGMLLFRLMFIARNAADTYGALVATGIFAHIALQVSLNVAVVTGVIPTTGITLPFISYGGTSILFLMAEMGIALGISRRIKLEDS